MKMLDFFLNDDKTIPETAEQMLCNILATLANKYDELNDRMISFFKIAAERDQILDIIKANASVETSQYFDGKKVAVMGMFSPNTKGYTQILDFLEGGKTE